MAIHQLSLDNLKHLDAGKANEALQVHLKRAALDCWDRPGDSKARTVTLSFSLVPVLADDGRCDEVKVQIHASSVVPKHKTKVYSTGLRANGVLAFNEDSLDHIDQTTLLNDEE